MESIKRTCKIILITTMQRKTEEATAASSIIASMNVSEGLTKDNKVNLERLEDIR